MNAQIARTVVTDPDQQVETVAVPLDAYSPRLANVDEREDRVSNDGARGVSDLPW